MLYVLFNIIFFEIIFIVFTMDKFIEKMPKNTDEAPKGQGENRIAQFVSATQCRVNFQY